VILFPLYIAAIWIPAWRHRRRPLGFAIALLGPIPIMLSAWMISALMPAASLMQTPWWLTLYGSAAGAIGLGALLIACAPRVARPHECAACHYDLRGNVTGVCPECGAIFSDELLGATSPAPLVSPSANEPASANRADPRAA